MEEYLWPRSIGTTCAVIHADGVVECTCCQLSLGVARLAYRHAKVCYLPQRPYRINNADTEENRYLRRLAQSCGQRDAIARTETLFGMYRYQSSGSVIEQVRAKTLAFRFLQARQDVPTDTQGKGEQSSNARP
jgi:hypothetical protein